MGNVVVGTERTMLPEIVGLVVPGLDIRRRTSSSKLIALTPMK
jgi:hypothetical protein